MPVSRTAEAVYCANCEAILPEEVLVSRDTAFCPACGADVMARVFPAILARPVVLSAAEMKAAEGDATCFFHQSKAAVVTCAQCGRFLCRLCQTELRGENWCPDCITSGISKKKVAALENHRSLYDSVALALATLPLFGFWTSLIGAPAALFVAIRYWRAPGSILRRTKVRFVLAIVLASVEIAAWTWGILYFIAKIGERA